MDALTIQLKTINLNLVKDYFIKGSRLFVISEPVQPNMVDTLSIFYCKDVKQAQDSIVTLHEILNT